jgi:hypothetical protein
VKAHQDLKRPYEDLDIWGRLNCDADKLAKQFQKLMDDGVIVRPLQEGFFTKSMEVGISACELGLSHIFTSCIKSVCIYREPST